MPTLTIARPAEGEFAPHYAPYVARVPEGDLAATLAAQPMMLDRLLGGLDEPRALFRYAEGKWSVKEVVGHLADVERIFACRLLRVSRGDATPLPGFDEDAYVAAAGFDRRPLRGLLDEFAALRAANLHLVRAVEPGAWTRAGTANGKPVSARALAWIMAGHVLHHAAVLEERYLAR